MRLMSIVDIPLLDQSIGQLSIQTRGTTAFLYSPHFVARLCLGSGKIEWLIERPTPKAPASTWNHPRRVGISGCDFWISELANVVVELLPSECGGINVCCLNAEVGKILWQQLIPIPEAAEWAEKVAAWSGAQTEEINAFIANDLSHLVICLSRQSRRSTHFSQTHNVSSLPPYCCQTDAISFNPLTGKMVWRNTFSNVFVDILERRSFRGIWSLTPYMGEIDFENGTNRIMFESLHILGWPVTSGNFVAVPWHSNREAGINWFDNQGLRVRSGTFRQSGIRNTNLHATGSGMALQANDQKLWWFAQQDIPLWSILAKPYIYHVYNSITGDVYVATDGNGGRILVFDESTGQEILNIKPPVGGAGTLKKIPGHDLLVAKFWTSPKNSTSGRLFTISLKDRTHTLSCECVDLIGTWEHGAVLVTGKASDRLGIIDFRYPD